MTLLFKDVIERINDKCPSSYIGIYRRTFQCIVKRWIEIASTRAYDGEVNVFQFCAKRMDGLLDFFLFGDVSRRSVSVVGVLLVQFIQQICAAANYAETVPLNYIFFKEGFSYARCGSDNEDIHIPFVCNKCRSQSYKKT